jgi:hypothetical protein
MKKKTIGIVGSRRRVGLKVFQRIEKKLLELVEEHGMDKIELVSGGCSKGADSYAEILAKKHQLTIKIYYAKWDKYGKGAGLKRNTYIAEDADILIATPAEDRTGGAEDTIRKATSLKKEIILL